MIGFAITPFIIVGAALGTILALINLRRPTQQSRTFLVLWSIGLTTFVSVMTALCAGIAIGIFSYPHYDAVVLETTTEQVEERDKNGNIDRKSFSRARLEFTGPDGETLTPLSRVRSTNGPHPGDIIRIAYRDGVVFELTGTSKVLYGIIYFFTGLGLVFFRFLIRDTFQRQK